MAACTGCLKCYELCPTDVFRWDAAVAQQVVAFAADCCTCYVCEEECPARCIAISDDGANPRQHSIYDRLGIPI